jgi:hypothetical protein
MPQEHDAELCELQARAEAIQRQLALVRRIDPETATDDVRELEVWLTERLDQLEMDMVSLEFGDVPLPQDSAEG